MSFPFSLNIDNVPRRHDADFKFFPKRLFLTTQFRFLLLSGKKELFTIHQHHFKTAPKHLAALSMTGCQPHSRRYIMCYQHFGIPYVRERPYPFQMSIYIYPCPSICPSLDQHQRVVGSRPKVLCRPRYCGTSQSCGLRISNFGCGSILLNQSFICSSGLQVCMPAVPICGTDLSLVCSSAVSKFQVQFSTSVPYTAPSTPSAMQYLWPTHLRYIRVFHNFDIYIGKWIRNWIMSKVGSCHLKKLLLFVRQQAGILRGGTRSRQIVTE